MTQAGQRGKVVKDARPSVRQHLQAGCIAPPSIARRKTNALSLSLSLSPVAHAGCELQPSWVSKSAAEGAVWNLSQDAFDRRLLASIIDGQGTSGEFWCDPYGNLCDVMTEAQAENAVKDVLTKAAAGWSRPNLRQLLALHINTANPSGFSTRGVALVGPNIAVGWGGSSSGPLGTDDTFVYGFTGYDSPSVDVYFEYAPEVEVSSHASAGPVLLLLTSCASLLLDAGLEDAMDARESDDPGPPADSDPDECEDSGAAESPPEGGDGECPPE
ncbi:MAG: hypothetical protein ABMA64_19380 [Myxococcota bacterium]